MTYYKNTTRRHCRICMNLDAKKRYKKNMANPKSRAIIAEKALARYHKRKNKTRRKNAVKKGLNPNDNFPLVKKLGMGLRDSEKALVCPKEQGQDVPKLSCATCMLCVDKPKIPAYV